MLEEIIGWLPYIVFIAGLFIVAYLVEKRDREKKKRDAALTRLLEDEARKRGIQQA